MTADQPASDGAQAEALELLSDGRLAVVFQTPAQELPPAEGLQLFLPSGEMDPSFKADARITGFALDAQQTSANTLLLAGSFGTNRSVAVRLRLDGAVDPQFSTPVTGTASRIALSSTGDALLFSARDHFAEGEQQLGWLVRLKPNGERDSQLQIPVCPSCVGAAFEEGGRILVWGEFTELDGHFSPGLARLLSDGSVDRSFVSGLAPGSGVASVARMPSGDLAAVGWLEVPEVAGVWTALVLEGDLDRRLYGWRPASNVLRVQTLSKAGLSYRLEMRSGLDGGGDWQLVREWTGADRIEELELPLEGAARYFRVVRD